jgi:hypothetical protein
MSRENIVVNLFYLLNHHQSYLTLTFHIIKIKTHGQSLKIIPVQRDLMTTSIV